MADTKECVTNKWLMNRKKEVLKFRFAGIFTPDATKACSAGGAKTLETGQGKKLV